MIEKKIRENLEYFLKLDEKYRNKHSGLTRYTLDLIRFILFCGIGFIPLTLIYALLVYILSYHFNSPQKIVNWTFLILVALFITSKISSYINLKWKGGKNK